MRRGFSLPLLAVVSAGCNDYGVTRTEARDQWIQEDRGAELDILWVLDDSASMTEEQEALLARVASFTTPLAASELPFRLALTTTAGDGGLLGSVVTPDDADMTAGFAAAIALAGVAGSREEQGFSAAIEASNADHNDFARADADLEVVFYTDEDDHSGLDAAEAVAELEALRPGRKVVTSGVVGDPPTGCASATGAADPGLAYIEAQGLTGGARESICTAEVDAMLERLANAVLGLRTEFFLSDLPLLDSMEVRVDGATIPRRDTDGWRYDGGDNSIIFDGWAIPRPGAVIEAAYFDYNGQGSSDPGASEGADSGT